MTPDVLDTLREGWDFEAKLAGGRDGRGALLDSIWETYSAMANTEGGLVLLGAKDPMTPNHPSQAYRARRQQEGDDA